jgi:hypothetical protein
MIRLSLLQFRAQAATAAAALAAFAAILAVSGPHLFAIYDSSGLATCQPHGDCTQLATSFINKAAGFYAAWYFIGIAILIVLPAVIGTFWGAPLITRELEAGTFQLAWTQSVTRSRWLAARLGVAALAAMATAGLFSLLLTWWSGPIDAAAPFDKGNSIMFLPARGITPVGYAAFAFALGAAAGVLIRRTLPAMAASLGGFALVQVIWAVWIRARLIPAAHAVIALTAANIPSQAAGSGGGQMVDPANLPGMTGDWVLSVQTVDPAGQPFNVGSVKACFGDSSFQACRTALGGLHLREVIAYQPASRFWAMQWYETGIFLAIALALAGFCFWWTGRRHLG